jgi:2-keto-4-pentenoate hydratase/2-oxohepta-3-ene-1,7-dioic acid hydratase in catechol pathway
VPKVSPFLDYEAELVAVIGKGGRHISREAAPASVFGYCCGNDATERVWQHRTPQWVLGKSFDTHAPFGPWITTADEVAEPGNLALRTWINGELRQDSNTNDLIFGVPEIVAFIGETITLEPGDLILTGTPSGVGMYFDPPRFLGSGDVVRIEIEGLGTIEHAVA